MSGDFFSSPASALEPETLTITWDEATETMVAPTLNATGLIDGSFRVSDPFLRYLPSWTYSLPVQMLVLGCNLTLICVLLIHLLFTLRYHYSLARVNYLLQFTASMILLVYISVSIGVSWSVLKERCRLWPYMFEYTEIPVPTDENGTGYVLWLLLNGLVTLSVHSIHIQFLTLLYPSRLEARLILGLLVPLAIAACVLEFTALINKHRYQDLGDAIRNVCNSTLTLLYASGLLIWGLFVNRNNAWRTDGGTAMFGVLAIFLAFLGTGVNYLEIKEDRAYWLSGIVSCILLWQSWVGFWWWVGSGMYTGEVEDLRKKELERKAREEKRASRRKAKVGDSVAQRLGRRVAALSGSNLYLHRTASQASTTALTSSQNDGSNSAGTRRRRGRRRQGANSRATEDPALSGLEEHELATFSDTRTGAGEGGASGGAQTNAATESSAGTRSTGSDNSTQQNAIISFLMRPKLFAKALMRLRAAHDEAAIDRAKEGTSLPKHRGLGSFHLPHSNSRGTQGTSSRPISQPDAREHAQSIDIATDHLSNNDTTSTGGDVDLRTDGGQIQQLHPHPKQQSRRQRQRQRQRQRNSTSRNLEADIEAQRHTEQLNHIKDVDGGEEERTGNEELESGAGRPTENLLRQSQEHWSNLRTSVRRMRLRDVSSFD